MNDINEVINHIDNSSLKQIIENYYKVVNKNKETIFDFKKFINDYNQLFTNKTEYKNLTLGITTLKLKNKEKRKIYNLSIGILFKNSPLAKDFLEKLNTISTEVPREALLHLINSFPPESRVRLLECISPIINLLPKYRLTYNELEKLFELFKCFEPNDWPALNEELQNLEKSSLLDYILRLNSCLKGTNLINIESFISIKKLLSEKLVITKADNIPMFANVFIEKSNEILPKINKINESNLPKIKLENIRTLLKFSMNDFTKFIDFINSSPLNAQNNTENLISIYGCIDKDNIDSILPALNGFENVHFELLNKIENNLKNKITVDDVNAIIEFVNKNKTIEYPSLNSEQHDLITLLSTIEKYTELKINMQFVFKIPKLTPNFINQTYDLLKAASSCNSLKPIELQSLYDNIPKNEFWERSKIYTKLLTDLKNRLDDPILVALTKINNILKLTDISVQTIDKLNKFPLRNLKSASNMSSIFKENYNQFISFFWILASNFTERGTNKLTLLFLNEKLKELDDNKKITLCLVSQNLQLESLTLENFEKLSKLNLTENKWNIFHSRIFNWIRPTKRFHAINDLLNKTTDFKSLKVFEQAVFCNYYKKDYNFLLSGPKDSKDDPTKLFFQSFLQDPKMEVSVLKSINSVFTIISNLSKEYQNFSFINSLFMLMSKSMVSVAAVSPKSYEYLLKLPNNDTINALGYNFFSNSEIQKEAIEYLNDLLQQDPPDDNVIEAAHWIAQSGNQAALNIVEEHPLVQKAYSVMVLDDTDTKKNKKNPFNVYDSLIKQNQTEPLIQTQLPAIDVIDPGTQIKYSISWNLGSLQLKALLAPSYTINDLPEIKKDLFNNIFKNLKDRLPTLNAQDREIADETIRIYGPDVDKIKYYLETGIAATYFRLSENTDGSKNIPISKTHYQLFQIAAFIQKKSVDINPKTMLSEREERLLGLGSVVRDCETGQKDGITNYYRDIQKTKEEKSDPMMEEKSDPMMEEKSDPMMEEKLKMDKLSDEEELIRSIVDQAIQDVLSAGFVKEAFLREFAGITEMVQQGVHSTNYATNRLFRHVGLQHTITFDRGTDALYDYSFELSNLDALKLYFKHTTPKDAIPATINASREIFKIKKLYSTLIKLLEKQEGEDINYDAYIKFNTVDNDIEVQKQIKEGKLKEEDIDDSKYDWAPIELKWKGAVVLLKALDYIQVDETRKRMLTDESPVQEDSMDENDDSPSNELVKKLKL